jgi:hypothetical protein
MQPCSVATQSMLVMAKQAGTREACYWVIRMTESRVDGRIHGAGTPRGMLHGSHAWPGFNPSNIVKNANSTPRVQTYVPQTSIAVAECMVGMAEYMAGVAECMVRVKSVQKTSTVHRPSVPFK